MKSSTPLPWSSAQPCDVFVRVYFFGQEISYNIYILYIPPTVERGIYLVTPSRPSHLKASHLFSAAARTCAACEAISWRMRKATVLTTGSHWHMCIFCSIQYLYTISIACRRVRPVVVVCYFVRTYRSLGSSPWPSAVHTSRWLLASSTPHARGGCTVELPRGRRLLRPAPEWLGRSHPLVQERRGR